MGIRFILMVNKQGQTRLAQYYEYLTIEQRRALEGEIVRKCLARNEQQCSFVEHRNYKIVYRRYASLFFLVGVDNEEKERAQPQYDDFNPISSPAAARLHFLRRARGGSTLTYARRNTSSTQDRIDEEDEDEDNIPFDDEEVEDDYGVPPEENTQGGDGDDSEMDEYDA
ncbi:hypothetical protein AgCh_027125 [Apium graveolens]